MKKILLVALLAVPFCSFGQTADNKNNISIGFGSQSYNGVLANTWFDFTYEWYGVLPINYSRYLNSSFDVTASTTAGNFGHCQNDPDDVQFWPDGVKKIAMKSMLVTANVAIKYKLANGYLLKEDAKISPYLYIGVGVNPVLDMWNHRVLPGTYTSLIGGAGVRYNITEKFNFTYNIGFGVFNNDKMDYGNVNCPQPKNPMYMQNTYTLGYNF
jgi:OOP family OmpA-OmpF porin